MTARREHRLVFLLNVAQRRLQRWMAARKQNSGVTSTQAGLLFILGQRDGVLMGEAGAAMSATNLIERRADPDDGRAWRLWLTPAGRAAMAQSKAGLAEVNARLTDGFTDAEIDIVARWLTTMQTRFPRGEGE
jgi:hypothetical protein